MKILRIVVPLLLIFILGISCFASPGNISTTSSYSDNNVGDSGFMDVQIIDNDGYSVKNFTVGNINNTMYSFDNIIVSSPIINGTYKSLNYTFNFGVGGIRLYSPVSFFTINQSGFNRTDSYINISFNIQSHSHIEYDYLNNDGTLTHYVHDIDNDLSEPIIWVEGLPTGKCTVLNYTCDVSFGNWNHHGVIMSYTDNFTGVYANNFSDTYVSDNYNSGYNYGYNVGYDDGWARGYDEGDYDGFERGLEADTFSGFGTFMTTVLGGFLNAPFIGGITVGGILIAFVGFAVALWLLKLLAGG